MVELLGQAELKTGQTIVIKHSSTLALSPAYTVFLREMANLMDNGHAFAGTSWQDIHCGIIWGEVDGEIAGIFAYSRQDIDRDQLINIVLTAVVQQYRQRGIHTVLNQYYEQLAKNLGCRFTCATVSPKNKTRLITAEKDGYTPYYYKLYKRLASE